MRETIYIQFADIDYTLYNYASAAHANMDYTLNSDDINLYSLRVKPMLKRSLRPIVHNAKWWPLWSLYNV